MYIYIDNSSLKLKAELSEKQLSATTYKCVGSLHLLKLTLTDILEPVQVRDMKIIHTHGDSVSIADLSRCVTVSCTVKTKESEY